MTSLNIVIYGTKNKNTKILCSDEGDYSGYTSIFFYNRHDL